MKHFILISVSTILLSACGTTNNYLSEKTKTMEYYRIFDIKTTATRQAIAKAASDGIGRNVNNAQEATPIPSSADLPDTAARFKLVNPFEGTRMAALAQSAGSIGFRVATCDGAAWTAKAQRNISGSNNLNLTACIFQYKGGYHLDLYAVFTKREGGLKQISRDMANAVVGTPEQWTEKTFMDIARSIRSTTGSEVSLLEAQPEVSGTPWLDDMAKK
ncbi:MAG: hypothetical protein ABL885_05850 [Methylophilaceae bacterium]